jgi:hypothetical protein
LDEPESRFAGLDGRLHDEAHGSVTSPESGGAAAVPSPVWRDPEGQLHVLI